MLAPMPPEGYTFTPQPIASYLGDPSGITSFAMTYAVPEMIRIALYMAGFLLIVYLVRRISAG